MPSKSDLEVTTKQLAALIDFELATYPELKRTGAFISPVPMWDNIQRRFAIEKRRLFLNDIIMCVNSHNLDPKTETQLPGLIELYNPIYEPLAEKIRQKLEEYTRGSHKYHLEVKEKYK